MRAYELGRVDGFTFDFVVRLRPDQPLKAPFPFLPHGAQRLGRRVAGGVEVLGAGRGTLCVSQLASSATECLLE